MESDICKCGATKADHENARRELAHVVNGRAAQLLPVACMTFRLDRKATWHAERGVKTKRTVTVVTGCPECGAKSGHMAGDRFISTGGITWQKDEKGRMRHVGCPGRKP